MVERCGSTGFGENRLSDGVGIDAFPVFNRKYGQQLPDGTYQVPAPWQSGLSNVSQVRRKRVMCVLRAAVGIGLTALRRGLTSAKSSVCSLTDGCRSALGTVTRS